MCKCICVGFAMGKSQEGPINSTFLLITIEKHQSSASHKLVQIVIPPAQHALILLTADRLLRLFASLPLQPSISSAWLWFRSRQLFYWSPLLFFSAAPTACFCTAGLARLTRRLSAPEAAGCVRLIRPAFFFLSLSLSLWQRVRVLPCSFPLLVYLHANWQAALNFHVLNLLFANMGWLFGQVWQVYMQHVLIHLFNSFLFLCNFICHSEVMQSGL